MNSGETIISIGALTLLMLVVLNMYRSLNVNDALLNDTRFGLESIAIATSLIEEISQYPFDEASWDTTKVEKVPSDFTPPADLGPDTGETNLSLFDDVDDFHNYTRTDTTEQNIYTILCQVIYVNGNNPDVDIGARSFFKKVTVSVTNTLNNAITRLNYVHGFWYFN